jgi:hypothetical protein
MFRACRTVFHPAGSCQRLAIGRPRALQVSDVSGILHFRRCSVPQLSSDRTDGLRTSVPEHYVFFFGTFDCKYLFFRFYSPFTSRCLSNNSSVRLRIMFGALGAQGWLFFLLFRSS